MKQGLRAIHELWLTFWHGAKCPLHPGHRLRESYVRDFYLEEPRDCFECWHERLERRIRPTAPLSAREQYRTGVMKDIPISEAFPSDKSA